jgi:hypothetical protein
MKVTRYVRTGKSNGDIEIQKELNGTLLVGGQPEAHGYDRSAWRLGSVPLHTLIPLHVGVIGPHLGGIHRVHVAHGELHLVAIPTGDRGPPDLQHRGHRSLQLIL